MCCGFCVDEHNDNTATLASAIDHNGECKVKSRKAKVENNCSSLIANYYRECARYDARCDFTTASSEVNRRDCCRRVPADWDIAHLRGRRIVPALDALCAVDE